MSKSYREQAESDAWDTLDNFVDEMVEQWKDDRKVSDDLNNDYSGGDSYHHETHVDKEYDLKEAAALLEELDEYEETDTGLWEGMQPRKAISSQAAYTYGNAVYSEWRSLVDDLNEFLDVLQDRLSGKWVENPAATETVDVAGEWLIRFYVLHLDGDAYDGMVSAAWDFLQQGDRTAALVLADKVQETGNDGLAKSIREAVSAEVEVEEPE